MHLYGTRVFERPTIAAHTARGPRGQVFVRGVEVRGQAGQKLRATAALMLGLMAGMPSGFAQQPTATTPDKQASNLPPAPAPASTEPLNLRTSARDYSRPAGRLLGNPIDMYRATTIPKASLVNSVRLGDLVKDSKIYLSLSDAIALALEKAAPGSVYNVSSGESQPNVKIVRTILRFLGKSDSLIQYVQDRPGHDRRYALDSSKIRRELGWGPLLGFEEGLRKTIEWYQVNSEWLAHARSGEYRNYYQRHYDRRAETFRSHVDS